MKRINSALFLASVASMALASGAMAQTLPTPGPNDGVNQLNGAGASSVTNVVNDEISWLKTNRPNFDAEYVATGSGTGKAAWRSNTPQVPAKPTWNTVQYAFSDSTISSSDVTTYNTNVKPFAGAGVFLPKFVLPVAFAYNPVYAKNPTSGVEYRFNVQNPQSLPDAVTGAAKVVGGLRLSRDLYCGIFNGDIKNWNNSALTTANGGVSLKDPADPNWGTVDNSSTQGVPIRLVGRLDKSGTTDIFTRALKAQCDTPLGAANNKYDVNSEALPFDYTPGTAPDFTPARSDTPYKPLTSTPAAGTFAGTINSVGNQYFDKTSLTIVSVSGGTASQPTSATGNGTGLFLLADGSSTVSKAIEADPDIGTSSYRVNGKLGYIGSDFIANAKGASQKVFAAAVSRPVLGSPFLLPSASNGTTAVGTVLPPQSDSNGDYLATAAGDRGDPLSWYSVLYPTPTTGLANPALGYPITGTTQILLNTCYKANNYPSIVTWLGYNVGTPTTVFTDDATGLLAKSNIAAVPGSWQRAITQTFLVNAGGTLGARKLWIEAASPSSDHCKVTGN
ncbi:substrate-binding domain-containing protein [Sphingobium sp. H39-3-25]|uniref:substrate-binding domain-containing protein n=1 Tax=Sphingobium TaxID=165695 RepID=UPI0023B9DA7F|nr:substrate-binding domain-containing protein [Sphingobium arseniciresistens]